MDRPRQIPPSLRFPDVRGQLEDSWVAGELSRAADELLMTSPALDSQGPSRKEL